MKRKPKPISFPDFIYRHQDRTLWSLSKAARDWLLAQGHKERPILVIGDEGERLFYGAMDANLTIE